MQRHYFLWTNPVWIWNSIFSHIASFWSNFKISQVEREAKLASPMGRFKVLLYEVLLCSKATQRILSLSRVWVFFCIHNVNDENKYDWIKTTGVENDFSMFKGVLSTWILCVSGGPKASLGLVWTRKVSELTCDSNDRKKCIIWTNAPVEVRSSCPFTLCYIPLVFDIFIFNELYVLLFWFSSLSKNQINCFDSVGGLPPGVVHSLTNHTFL